MSKAKILVVEDDDSVLALICDCLEYADYDVSGVIDGAGMLHLLQEQHFDLILLDIMLPGKNGYELARAIRQSSNIPIIFITAKTQLDDKVKGFEVGADDYIAKPFQEPELLARIKTILRRVKLDKSVHNKAQVVFAGWKLHLINQTLYSPENKRVNITGAEYQVLYALLSHPHRVVSRGEILSMISGREWSPLDRSADMTISKLRKKIEKDPKNPSIIKTIRNKGYQITANVIFEDATIEQYAV